MQECSGAILALCAIAVLVLGFGAVDHAAACGICAFLLCHIRHVAQVAPNQAPTRVDAQNHFSNRNRCCVFGSISLVKCNHTREGKNRRAKWCVAVVLFVVRFSFCLRCRICLLPFTPRRLFSPIYCFRSRRSLLLSAAFAIAATSCRCRHLSPLYSCLTKLMNENFVTV